MSTKTKLKQLHQSGAVNKGFAQYNSSTGLWEPWVPVYGNLRAENQSTAITLTTQSQFYLYNQFEASDLGVNCTPDFTTNHRITVDEAGDYEFHAAGTGEGLQVGATYQWELFKNGFRLLSMGCRQTFDDERDLPFAMGGQDELAANDYIDLRVRCISQASATIRGREAMLTIKRIG